MRGRSYTPSPPRGYGRRGRSPSPRGRYGGSRSRDLPTSLLVRNLRHDCRPDDLRRPFEQFGALKDIYLPRDYYTREPRGFGFVQFVDPADAADAKYRMDGYMLMGRELTVVFAEENRKKPVEMRQRERGSGRAVSGGRYDRRRSPPRYSRSPRYSQSPPPRHTRHVHRSHDDYYSPPRRRFTRSPTPQGKRVSRERSRTPPRPSRERSYSRSPSPMNGSRRERSYSRTPPVNGSRSRSQSPVRGRGRSRSRSPYPPVNYSLDMNGERSPSR